MPPSRRDGRRRPKRKGVGRYLAGGLVLLLAAVVVFAVTRRTPTGHDGAKADVPQGATSAVLKHARRWAGEEPTVVGRHHVRGRRGAGAQDQIESMAGAGNLDGKAGDRNAAGRGRPVPPPARPTRPNADDRVDGAYLVEFDRPVSVFPDEPPYSRWWVYLMCPDGTVSMFFPADRGTWRDAIREHLVAVDD